MADKNEMHQALEAAKERAEGASSLARALRITPQAVNQWFVVPPERVLEVERLTGISRHFLRPDVFGPPLESPACSSAGGAGASLPPSDAPASLSQDRAAVAQLVHTQQVAGSNPAPATSFQSPDFSGSGDEGGAAFHTSAVLPDVSKSPDNLPSGVTAGARRKDDAGRAPASSVLGSAV